MCVDLNPCTDNCTVIHRNSTIYVNVLWLVHESADTWTIGKHTQWLILDELSSPVSYKTNNTIKKHISNKHLIITYYTTKIVNPLYNTNPKDVDRISYFIIFLISFHVQKMWTTIFYASYSADVKSVFFWFLFTVTKFFK